MPIVSRDEVDLYFDDVGSGVPVLFHTGGGGDGRMWELAGYTEAFAGYRQLILDHRGHGRSGSPASVEAHRVEEYVADVVAVLDGAGVDRVVLIGYSAGAGVAYRVAALHADRCAALVALGSVPVPGHDPDPNLEFAAHVRTLGMRAAIEEMAAEEDEPAPGWLIDNLSSTATEMFALRLEAWAHASSAWDALPAIKAPTLIVCGEHEQGDGEVEKAAARLPEGTAVVLPGYGHLQTFWHAETTGPVVSRFVRSALDR